MSTQQVSDTSEETQLGVDLPENQKTWGDWRTYHDFFTDKFVWEIIYQKKEKGFYVEAGACDGVIQSQTKMLDEKGWDGLLVEPAWPSKAIPPLVASFLDLILKRVLLYKISAKPLVTSDSLILIFGFVLFISKPSAGEVVPIPTLLFAEST